MGSRIPTPGGWGARRLNHTEQRIRELQKRGPGPWIYVGTFPTGTLTTYWSPPYENGWAWAGTPYARPAFRHGLDGSLEFKGHLDSSGAATDTVAFTLPDDWLPDNDISWPTDLWDGAAFMLARFAIDSATGEATISFPVT